MNFTDILAQVAVLLLVWAPVEAAVLYMVWTILRQVRKLSALYEMAPDLTARQRRFVRWWAGEEMKTSMDLAEKNWKPGKRPPWD